MTIIIGTSNPIKIQSLKDTISQYDFLKGALVQGVNTKSNVADQPANLAETIKGAQNRAYNAFKDTNLSVGIEDGLMTVPQSLTGSMNVCVCVFYDGNRYYMGLSAAFEYPPAAIKLVGEGLDINQAFYKLKLTDDPKVGSSQGAIGILTKNRWTRSDTIKQSIVSALIQLENKQLY